MQTSMTHVPQYVRLVDFMDEIQDLSLILARAAPDTAGVLVDLVNECLQDLANLAEE